MADESLVVRHTDAAGDRDEEFREFMESSASRLGHVAYLLTGDMHRAEELTQLALVRTYEAWSRARQRDPHAYARKVLVNASVDRWRRTRREVLLSPEGLPDKGSVDESDTIANREFLRRALSALSKRQRQVVVLRYLLELSEQETADELEIPVGTVKSALARGLERLRTVTAETSQSPPSSTRGGTPHAQR